jgi:lysyl-tRNA synthetase class 2
MSWRRFVLKRALLAVAGSFVGILFVISGIGLLFWLRSLSASWPGPRVVDALPLGELPRLDRMPMSAFIIVWIVIALALGILVRAARIERLTAAALLTVGVGLVLYFIDVLSLYLVRQIPAHSAFASAATVRAIYPPAIMAGIAGAFLGRARGEPGRGPTLLAVLVGAVGVLGVLSAATPAEASRLDLLHRYVPAMFPPLATAAVAAAGLALVLCARGLARRKRRAWVVAVVLLGASAVFHVLKGLDLEESMFVALVATALIASRHEFDRPGDPASRSRALSRFLVFGGAVYAYGVAALWIRHLVHRARPFSLARALAITSHALVSPHIPASERMSEWFPLSLSLVAIAGVIAVVSAWLAPWRFLKWTDEQHRAKARAIVDRWGSDALAPFTLRTDKTVFFEGARDAFLAYRVVGGVAFVSGDPVGPTAELPNLMRTFLAHAGARDWQVAVLGASDIHLSWYRTLGLRPLYWGDEAVVDAQTFSLEGRGIRKTRQSVHRLERAGFSAEFVWAGDVSRALRDKLLEIDGAWLGGKGQRGGTMSMDDLFELDDALFVIGRNADGEPCGFLHFAVCRAGSTLSLSRMPRLAFTPNGFNEWLIVCAIEWARANGFEHLSLNFAPFARLFADGEATGVRRLTRELLMVIKARLQLQLDNLYLFNQKFLPRWEPRYVVYQRRAHLPRIGVAALAAEGYLRAGAAG